MSCKFSCKFCNNTYTTNSNLIHHQKTAKFCLLIQQEKGELTKQDRFLCVDSCQYFTYKKDDFNKHTKTCKHVRTIEQEKILTIQNELLICKTKLESETDRRIHAEQIADKPRITNNTNNLTYINIQNYLSNYLDPIEQMIPKIPVTMSREFKAEHVKSGLASISTFISNKVLTDEAGNKYYASIESPNGKPDFYYKEKKEIKLDLNGKIIQQQILPHIVTRTKQIYNRERYVNDSLPEDLLEKHMKPFKEAKKEAEELLMDPSPLLKCIHKNAGISRTSIKIDPYASTKAIPLRLLIPENIDNMKKIISSWTDEEATNYLDPNNFKTLWDKLFKDNVDYRYDRCTDTFYYIDMFDDGNSEIEKRVYDTDTHYILYLWDKIKRSLTGSSAKHRAKKGCIFELIDSNEKTKKALINVLKE